MLDAAIHNSNAVISQDNILVLEEENRGHVLLMEDTEISIHTTEHSLESANFNDDSIFYAQTLTDADYFVNVDPGWNSFAILIIDLNIPGVYEKHFSKEELKDLDDISRYVHAESVKLSGWVWLKRLLSEHPQIRDRVVVLSAYVAEIPESEINRYGEGILFLDKVETESVDKLRKKLRECTRY